MAKELHQKIRSLKLRTRGTIQRYDARVIYEDPALVTRVAEHIAELRSKKSIQLTENQVLVCFCVWGVRDTHGTGWLRGSFNMSIEQRGPESSANQKIAFCWYHRLDDPIGRPIKMFDDEFGAYAVCEFDDVEAVPSAKRVKSQIKSKTINGYSFGFEYIWDKMEYDEKTDTIWIREAALYEVSPVTFASIKETSTVRSLEEFESRKMALDEQTKDFINSMPKGKQLELRQLIDDHITLAKYEPEETLEQLKTEDGDMSVGSYKINVNKL